MSYDSTAILERTSARMTLASGIGESNGCFFCAARNSSIPGLGSVVAKLNGYDSGQLFRIRDDGETAQVLGDGGGNSVRRIPASACELFGAPPLIPEPWFPPLSLRDSFIIDELAVWFIDRGLMTTTFHWKIDDCIEVARTLWTKRVPLEPPELSQIFCAHGLPVEHQRELEHHFNYATKVLLTQHPRKIIRKKRLAGFENMNSDPALWADAYIIPFLGAH